LQPIVCLSVKHDGTIAVCYPAKLFPDTPEGKLSRSYVERYLDSTKSAMLFAKATVFVEGIAEQLVVPALAQMLQRSFDQHHVAIVRVDGLTFKHFLPLFGAGVPAVRQSISLLRRVACVIDSDPARTDKTAIKKTRKSCFPFQLARDAAKYEYHPQSGTVANLNALTNTQANIRVFTAVKTFEYDLALANHQNPAIITAAIDCATELKTLMDDPSKMSEQLNGILDTEETADLAAVGNKAQRDPQLIASLYLRCAEGAKGEHAFALEQHIRTTNGVPPLACPSYLKDAIEWVTAGAVARGN